MNRRRFLAAAGVLLAALPAYGHTPYRQWKVMRERFLLVHSTRTDPVSDALAERIVAILNAELPDANAMVARAPNLERVASLLTSDQARLAVVARDAARRFYLRQGEFAAFDGTGLRVLVELETHLLLATASLPKHHAWLLASALSENPSGLAVRIPDAAAEPPTHAGARAFARGEPLDPQQ